VTRAGVGSRLPPGARAGGSCYFVGMGSLRRFLRGSRPILLTSALLASACASLFVPSDASASVSIAVGFDALVKDADAVVVITPNEAQSVWEDGRIYTYTKVKVDQGVAGDLGAGADGWVRTMGGVVGKIGQMVDGEPVFQTGKPSLLFLRKFKENTVFEVSARGQGQYPIKIDETTHLKRLIKSAHGGLIIPPKPPANAAGQSGQVQTQSVIPNQSPGASLDLTKQPLRLAQDVLHERSFDEATREISAAWKRTHPPPPPAK
jgi:hypothetical protein